MLVYKVRKNKLLEFVNEYEPLWIELCDLYEFGMKSKANNILKSELNTIDLEITILCEADNNGMLSYFDIEAINHKDNDCIVYHDWRRGSTEVNEVTDWLEYLELVNEVNEEN